MELSPSHDLLRKRLSRAQAEGPQKGTQVNAALSPQLVWSHNVRRHFSCCYAARVAHPGLLALFLFLRVVLSTRVHSIIYKRCFVMHHHLYSRPLIHKKKLLLDLFLTEESRRSFWFEITNKLFWFEIMIAGPQQSLNKWCWCHKKESELPGDGGARGLALSALRMSEVWWPVQRKCCLQICCTDYQVLSGCSWNRAQQTQRSCS